MTLLDYVVIDIETTGLNPKIDKIIEIGAAKVRNKEVCDTYITYINPGRSLSEKVTQITGITDSDLMEAPFIESELPKLIEFIGEDVLLGHNIIFDYSFIKKAAVNLGIAFEKDGIDTLRIARRFVTESESKRLGDLCNYYGIHLDAHRALNDAIATHELYKKLVNEFSYKEEDTFHPQKLVYSVKKEGPVTPRQKENLEKLCKMYHITIDNNNIMLCDTGISIKGFADIVVIDRLTKNEASRLIDLIRFLFASRC